MVSCFYLVNNVSATPINTPIPTHHQQMMQLRWKI
jgi:hypothetical protein